MQAGIETGRWYAESNRTRGFARMTYAVVGTSLRSAAKLGAVAAIAAVGLFGGSTDASAQIIAQPGANDYCADASPDGRRPQAPRTFINIAPPTGGSVSARMWGTGAECVLTQPATCPANCRIQIQTVCEFHCSHNHTPPYPWTVELYATPDPGNYLLGWGASCAPIKTAPQASCIVRMSSDQNVSARFGPAPDTSPPSAPSLTPMASKYEVDLRWTPSGDDNWVGGYDIYVGSRHEARVAANATSYTIQNLLCNEPYTLRIEAFDVQNRTGSASVDVRTLACGGTTRGPVPNTQMHVAQVTRRSIYLHWGATRARATKHQCKLDRGRWTACRPGKTYRNLSRGWHTVRVRSGNANGWDATPAVVRRRIR
jgi:hypothetical protein